MRVKMKQMYAGPRGVCSAGGVLDLPDDEAQQLIAGGYAEALDTPAPERSQPVEVAEADPAPEAAVEHPRTGRRQTRRVKPPTPR